MCLYYDILFNKVFKVKVQDMNNQEQLFKLAFDARKLAYAPYSSFKVGAAILSDKDNFYVGNNVENVSYPVGTCAEAGAIAAMVAHGDKKIKEILIIADGKNVITPCGACLQRIKEFATKKTIVHLANLKAIQKSYLISELLPHAFEEELKK